MNRQKPVRIAFVLSSLRFGGGERVALNLAHALQAEGCEIDFLLMSVQGEFLEEAVQHFTVHDLDCPRTWRLPFALARYLRRHRPYALISSFWKLNLCSCIARLFDPGCKLLLWEHSPPSRSKNSPTWLYTLTASSLYHLGSKVITVSTGVFRDVRRITFGLGRKTVIIFNPVSPPPLAAQCTRSHQGRRSIIWVGRLDAPKNPQLALEAFALLPSSTDSVLQIVGEGRLRAELEDRAASLGLRERVRFLGFRRDAYALMAQADLLVLSSDREGLPTVLVEALYCGLPIVSTDCGEGVQDILAGERYGSIVPVGDPHALAAAIRRELAAPRDGRTQRAGADRFRPTEVVRQFLSAMNLDPA